MTTYDKYQHFTKTPGSLMERFQLWLTGDTKLGKGMISSTTYPDEDLIFETVLEHFAGMSPSYTIKSLKESGMSQEQIKRLKKWWLEKGLHEGWLETEYFDRDI